MRSVFCTLIGLLLIHTAPAAEILNEAPKAAPKAEAPKAEASKAEPAKSEEPAAPKRRRRRAEAEDSVQDDRIRALNAAGKVNATNLVMITPQGCYVVSFGQAPGQEISCKEPLALEYTKRNCESSAVEETATSEAMVSCDNESKLNMKFKTTAGVLSADLRLLRTQQGRAGIVSSYIVDKALFEETSIAKLLAEPVVKAPEEAKSIEEPLRFKASGFVSVEHEMISQYGVNASVFSAAANPKSFSGTNIFSNIAFELSKDRTTFVSLFELGEIYFGVTNSPNSSPVAIGGGAGTNENTRVLELRNIYLAHDLTDHLTLRAGKITTASDPRSFIANDHIASIQATYKTDLSEGLLWFGNVGSNLPGDTRVRDIYAGFNGTLGFLSKIKGTVFVVGRSRGGETLAVETSPGSGTYANESLDTGYLWAGGTFDYQGFNPVAFQFTGIGNWGSATNGAGISESLKAYLLDTRVSFSLPGPELSFTLEGLLTSGAANATSGGNSIFGARKNFQSPVNASYLLTLATSDGVDDAPGSAKGMANYVGTLSQPEGLQFLVLTASKNLTSKLTTTLRFGLLSAAAASSTGSKAMGHEYDVNAVYQLSPSTTLQLDYAALVPGEFYATRDLAQLFATKIRFAF
jgi:hypothetical protein